MASATGLNDRPSTYLLYRAELDQNAIDNLNFSSRALDNPVAIFAQNPVPEVHVEMSMLHREFRDRYIAELITKIEDIPVLRDEKGTPLSMVSQTLWEIASKMGELTSGSMREHPHRSDLQKSYKPYVMAKDFEINTLLSLRRDRLQSVRRPGGASIGESEPSNGVKLPEELVFAPSNSLELPEELVHRFYGYLSCKETAKAARVHRVWNQAAKAFFEESVSKYLHGFKELECWMFEALGPSPVSFYGGGMGVSACYEAMEGSRDSAQVYFRNRDRFKEKLTIELTHAPSNVFAMQLALGAIGQTGLCVYPLKNDIEDCLESAEARTGILSEPIAEEQEEQALIRNFVQRALGVRRLIQERLKQHRFGEAFGLINTSFDNEERVLLRRVAIFALLPIDPELAWERAVSSLRFEAPDGGRELLLFVVSKIPAEHVELKARAMKKIATLQAIGELPQQARDAEDEEKEEPARGQRSATKRKCIVS